MTRNINGSRKEIAKELEFSRDDPIVRAQRAAFALLPDPVAGEGDVQITVQSASDGGGTSINVMVRLNHPPAEKS